MPDTLEKDYVMCVFEILDGEREYNTKYFYPYPISKSYYQNSLRVYHS